MAKPTHEEFIAAISELSQEVFNCLVNSKLSSEDCIFVLGISAKLMLSASKQMDRPEVSENLERRLHDAFNAGVNTIVQATVFDSSKPH